MATTALKIEAGTKVHRLKFMTVDEGDFLSVEVYQCNEEFVPVGVPEVSIDDKIEEAYHTSLRIQAKEKGQFVPEESTNPEWNPANGTGKDR